MAYNFGAFRRILASSSSLSSSILPSPHLSILARLNSTLTTPKLFISGILSPLTLYLCLLLHFPFYFHTQITFICDFTYCCVSFRFMNFIVCSCSMCDYFRDTATEFIPIHLFLSIYVVTIYYSHLF